MKLTPLRTVFALCIFKQKTLFAGAAARVNPGFETGTFDGWTVVGLEEYEFPFVTSHIDGDDEFNAFNPYSYDAPFGKYFAVIPGGYNNRTNYITQKFSGDKGDIISGKAAFVAIDYFPWDDSAKIEILEGGTVLYQKSISSTSDTSTPWSPFSYVLPHSGTFTIKASSTNDYDAACPSSFLLVDTAEVCTTSLMSWNMWDADADKVTQILDGADVCLPDSEVNFEAYYGECEDPKIQVPKNPIDKVVFKTCVNGKCYGHTERVANYFAYGNSDKTSFVNGRDAKEGTYVLTAKAYNGTHTFDDTMTFKMIDCGPGRNLGSQK